jgi:hypothetical protein
MNANLSAPPCAGLCSEPGGLRCFAYNLLLLPGRLRCCGWSFCRNFYKCIFWIGKMTLCSAVLQHKKLELALQAA